MPPWTKYSLQNKNILTSEMSCSSPRVRRGTKQSNSTRNERSPEGPRSPLRGYFTPGSQGARFGGSSRAIGDCCGDYLPGLPSFPGQRTVPRFGGRPRGQFTPRCLTARCMYIYYLGLEFWQFQMLRLGIGLE